MISHIVDLCPLMKLDGDLSRLHSVGVDATSGWQTLEGEPAVHMKAEEEPEQKSATRNDGNENQSKAMLITKNECVNNAQVY